MKTFSFKHLLYLSILLLIFSVLTITKQGINYFNSPNQKAQALSPQTYYIDATSGNDTNTGLSTDQAWKTIAKVNSSTFNPGDQILFKRGETWREQLTIPSSGSSGSPIVFDAYGSGAKPIITGADTVTNWTQHEGNIYVADVGSITPPNQLYVDGNFYDVAHYPNSGYLIATDNAQNSTSVIDTNLTLTSDQIVGSTVQIRTYPWVILAKNVLSYDEGSHTFSYNEGSHVSGSAGNIIKKGQGFYFENKLWMLDTPGEWYYDSSSGKLYLWTTGGDDPTNHTVEVPKRSYGIYVIGSSHVTIQNISVNRAVDRNIYVRNANNIVISLNDISYGENGIYFYNVSSSSINGNTVSNAIKNGIQLYDNESYINISNNNITGVGTVGVSPKKSFASIYVGEPNTSKSSNIIINDNSVSNSGYIGIWIFGSNIKVENNTVDRSCLVLDDCGGIYTSKVQGHGTGPAGKNVIIGNKVTNSIGNYEGTIYNFTQAQGIYLDAVTFDTNVLNNTISNSDFGIQINDGHDNVITGNSISARSFALSFTAGSFSGAIDIAKNNIITGNNFEAAGSNGAVYFQNTYGSNVIFGTLDNNQYCHPNSSYPIRIAYKADPTKTALSGKTFSSITDWQTFSGQDANSTDIKGPCPLTLPNPIVSTPPPSTPPPPPPTPASCSTTLDSCTQGTFSDVTDTSNQSIWMCLGLNGGSNTTCSSPKDPNISPTPTPTPILRATDGICGNTLNSCTQGILRNTEDSTTQYLWMCLGSNNGFDASCSQTRYIPPVTTNPPTNLVNQPRTPSSYKPQPTIYKTGTTPNKDTYTINIPTSTIDITLPKPPSWLDVIKTLLNKIITNIIRGVKRTGEVIGI